VLGKVEYEQGMRRLKDQVNFEAAIKHTHGEAAP
jgi:hypothetical protein